MNTRLFKGTIAGKTLFKFNPFEANVSFLHPVKTE